MWEVGNAPNELSLQAKVRENIEEPDFAKFKSKTVSHSRLSKILK